MKIIAPTTLLNLTRIYINNICDITFDEFSLSYRESKDRDSKQLMTLHSEEKKYKITKAYLEEMDAIEEFYSLLTLCPHMEYFKVGYINNIVIKLFLCNIFEKLHHGCDEHLRLLCFPNPNADYEIIQILEESINDYKLFTNYMFIINFIPEILCF